MSVTTQPKDNSTRKVTVLDIETTGRKPHNGTIVEIGICLLDLDTGEITPIFNSVVRELDFEVCHEAHKVEKSWVFQNSNLTIEEVRKAPLLSEFRDELQIIFDKYPITAYNKAFDFGFLRDRGFKLAQHAQCPMICATSVLKIPGYYGKYKWPSVQEAWGYFYPEDTHYKELHRAYDDAVHEAKIVYALSQKGYWIL